MKKKSVRKTLTLYRHHYHLGRPANVVADGTFLQKALKMKIAVKQQLVRLLGEKDATVTVTPCVLAELELLGHRVGGALHIARLLEVHPCGHDVVVSARACLEAVGKSKRHLIATQDERLAEHLRSARGVGLIRLESNVPVLEGPSRETEEDLAKRERALITQAALAAAGGVAEPPRKRRRLRQPNPMSCPKSARQKRREKIMAEEDRRRRLREQRGRPKKAKHVAFKLKRRLDWESARAANDGEAEKDQQGAEAATRRTRTRRKRGKKRKRGESAGKASSGSNSRSSASSLTTDSSSSSSTSSR
jgi:rRNA-processing protein FCF1